MPTSESLKCYPVYDSNIPLRKKIHRGREGPKRPKVLSKFPELSRYIETIVNGEEDQKTSDGDGCSGEAKNSMSKKNNKRSENKEEILKKIDSCTNHQLRKSKTKKNVPDTEHQSREDSVKERRSVQTVQSTSDWSKVDIVYAGKCLENLYPNPYDLENMEDLPRPKRKNDERTSKNARFSDLFDITHEIITKAKNMVIPELEINQNVLQAKKPRTAKTSPDPENCVMSILLKGQVLGRNDEPGVTLGPDKSWDSVKSEKRIKGKAFSNSSSSRESDRREPRYHVNVRRKHKTGNPLKKTRDANLEDPGDIDLKKIKFITSSYLNDAIQKTGERKRKSDKFCLSSAENSSKLKYLKKTQDCFNLAQPQGLLKRTHEKLTKSARYGCDTENQKYIRFLNEFSLSKTFAQKEEQTRNFKFPVGGTRDFVVIEEMGDKRFPESKSTGKANQESDTKKLTRDGPFERKKKDAKDEYSSFLGSEEFWKGFEKRSAVVDYDKLFETSKKIDDVLQFMYNCLQKFKHEHKPKTTEESPVASFLEDKSGPKCRASVFDAPTTSYSCVKERSIESICHIQRPPEKIYHIQSAPLVQERHEASPTGETSGFVSGPESQSRRTQVGSEFTSRSVHGIGENAYRTIPTRRETICGYAEPPVRCESVEVQPEPEIQTVEVQNELGGYTEEARTTIVEDPKLTKAILPHSVKFRNWKNDACEVIKNALENEEKLLASGGSSKEPPEGEFSGWNVVKPSLGLLPSDEILMTSYVPGPGGAYSLIGGVDQQCPCFVIYVNSLPSILIPEAPPPLSIAFNEARALDLGHFRPSKSSLTKLCVAHDSVQKVSSYSYRFKEDLFRLLNKSTVAHVAGFSCLRFVSEIPKSEVSESSECFISFSVSTPRVVPEEHSCVHHSFQEEETNSEVLRLRDAQEPENADEEEESEENSEGTPMRDLEDAVKEAEENVLHLQEQKEPGGGAAEKRKPSDLVLGAIKENSGLAAEKKKKKVHDLLLRTYTLQNILHRYLHKMTCLRASSTSCPLIHHETFLDLEVLFREKTFAEVLEEVETPQRHCHFVVYWPSETSETQRKIIDLGASGLPSRGKKPQQKETAGGRDEDPRNRLSVSSRKSSSDTVDDWENSNEDLSKSSQEFQLLNRIFNELELSRRRHPRVTDSQLEEKNVEDKTENQMRESKFPTKVLKTLFKGEEDSSGGLKDDLKTERNASPGGKRFSVNYTPSRIDASRGKANKTKKISQESGIQINRGSYNKLSFFDLDSLRPTVSTCLSEHSKLGSDTLNCGSDDDDEEDFKSVNSSLSSGTESEEEDNQGAKENVPKEMKMAPERISSKPPFDLYRRKTTGGEGRTRLGLSSMYRYKELAPLQQALTEMQVRMRRINRDSINTNEYYRKALKLAKMSAGYCQNCGNHSVIPEDTFGLYKNLLPPGYSPQSQDCFFRNAPHSSFYSFRSRSRDVSDHLLDINLNQSSYNMLGGSSRSARTFLKSSLHDHFFLG